MRYRALGRSGIQVSEIGFGAWGIGGRTEGPTSYGETDDSVSIKALEVAFDQGINFFDTSAVYGYGHSEALIGQVFSKRRDQVVLATKAGYERYDQVPDFTPTGLARSLNQSLGRLRTSYIDLYQLHNPAPSILFENPEIFETLLDLRRRGVIRAIGVSARNPAEGRQIIENFPVDALQINLNMLDLRSILVNLPEAAIEQQVALIARTPLCFGFLTGKIEAGASFPASDHRSRWAPSLVELWRVGAEELLATVESVPGQTKSQIALRYCLSVLAVASVIPGVLRAEEAIENAAASKLGPLSHAEMTKIAEVNRRFGYFNDVSGLATAERLVMTENRI